MASPRQIDTLKNKNRREELLKTPAEKICGIKKSDRIAPVYTICLYHGVETWDGPRTLQDMMDFEDGQDSFRKIFKDYPMHLYCVNEAQDLQVFHTEIGILFQSLQYRKDTAGLKNLMMKDARYRHIDADTLETMSVMLEQPSFWKKREKYMEKNEDREEYDMCQALKEWAEEERSIGFAEGQQTGFVKGQQTGFVEGKQTGLMESRRAIVRNMLLRGMADADIMAIAECDQEFINEVRIGI